jgi:hypothetical protein
MNTIDKHEFSSDRPINKIEQDLLGRSGFSQDLAKALAGWHGNDSLVVALHGEWGSGKSSIKNMALNELEKIDKHTPDIIEFSPWEWAAQDKITASFFKEISSTIGLKNKSSDGKKLAKLFRKYGRYLNTGEIVTTGLISAVPTLVIILVLLGLTFFDTSLGQSLIQVSLGSMAIIVATLKWGKSLSNVIAGNREATAKEEELTLNQLRQELTKLLRKRDKSLIIILDDLDRLTKGQLQMVFQLVKANTEFPNVVFVLLFQRDLVEDKLTEGKQVGRDFLEKIIQVPFDIPRIETSRVHNLLFIKLNEIIDRDQFAMATFDQTYWSNLFHGSLSCYFNNLRNVYRFTSTLSFHFSLYQGEKAFEVNPVDLIAIECIRLFEPDVYKEISQSKDFFTQARSVRSQPDRVKEEKRFTQILNLASDNKEMLTNLLHSIFPALERISGKSYASSYYDSWLRDMRVCHPSNFDKYFLFSIPSEELSHSELQEMFTLTDDALALTIFIKALHKRGILKNALGQFSAFVDKIPIENSKSFICAMLNSCDEVGNDDFSFSLNSTNYMTIFVEKMIKRIDNIDERERLLVDCFQKPESGLNILESILQYEENKREQNETDFLLTDYTFDILKSTFVDKLDLLSESQDNILINHPQLSSFIYRWKRWGDDKKVCSWMNAQVKNPDFSLIVLQLFTQRGFSRSWGDHASRKTTEIKLEHMEEFFPINLMENSLKNLDSDNLNLSELEAIKDFTIALSNK